MGFATVARESHYYPEFGMARMSSGVGRRWADLMAWVTKRPLSDPHSMALTRTLRSLVNALHLDPALKREPLCTVCASTTLEAYMGSEDDLIALYHENLNAITQSIGSMRLRKNAAQERAA